MTRPAPESGDAEAHPMCGECEMQGRTGTGVHGGPGERGTADCRCACHSPWWREFRDLHAQLVDADHELAQWREKWTATLDTYSSLLEKAERERDGLRDKATTHREALHRIAYGDYGPGRDVARAALAADAPAPVCRRRYEPGHNGAWVCPECGNPLAAPSPPPAQAQEPVWKRLVKLGESIPASEWATVHRCEDYCAHPSHEPAPAPGPVEKPPGEAPEAPAAAPAPGEDQLFDAIERMLVIDDRGSAVSILRAAIQQAVEAEQRKTLEKFERFQDRAGKDEPVPWQVMFIDDQHKLTERDIKWGREIATRLGLLEGRAKPKGEKP